MKINIENKISNKLLWLNTGYSNAEEFALVKKLYLEILSKTLMGRSIKIITIAPQEYSLGYDFKGANFKTLNNQSYLISSIGHCDLELLQKVVSSEEFRRTLLIIVKSSCDLSDSELPDIVGLVKSKLVTMSNEIIFCEDDGDSLCLYNSDIDLTELISISKQLTSDITVEAN